MKYFKKMLLLIFLLISASINGQSSTETFNLNGNVKSVTESSIWFYDNQNKGSLTADSVTYLFNRNGFLVKEENYGDGSSCALIKSFTSEGNLLEQTCRFCGESSRKIFTYNDRQLLVKIIAYSGGPSITLFKYNKQNQVISEEFLDTSNVLGPAFEWTRKDLSYSADGIVLKSVENRAESFSKGFSSWTIETYEYDSTNKVTSIIRLDSSQSLSYDWSKRVYKYDKLGNVVFKLDTNIGTTHSIERNEFRNGTLVRKTRTYFTIDVESDTTEKGECIWEYDINNNVVYANDLFGEKRFTYEFDRNNNWIKKTKFIKGKPSQVFERKIEYFDND